MSFTTAFPTVTSERTYYCFIKSIDYVNINTFEITYAIDWIQTFLFDFQIGVCFVEREHVNTDAIGEHTLDERVDIGELVTTATSSWLETPAVMTQILPKNGQLTVKYRNGVITPVLGQSYPATDGGSLQDTLNTYRDTPEQVIQVCMIASSMATQGGGLTAAQKDVSFSRAPLKFIFQSDQYTPVNNKMFCYPFMLFTVDNYGNSVEQFHYEDFLSPTGDFLFRIDMTPEPTPSMICYPKQYKNQGESTQEGITYDNFPKCAWQSSPYEDWLNRNGKLMKNQLALNVITKAMVGSAGGAAGAVTSGLSIMNDIMGYQVEEQYHKIHGSALAGDIESAGINFSRGRIGFRVIQFGIKPEAARRIDRKFTRFGYRVDTAKIPNITGRQYFNYVKCNGAEVIGNIAIDAQNAMVNALNSGVTFWHTDNISNDYPTNPIV